MDVFTLTTAKPPADAMEFLVTEPGAGEVDAAQLYATFLARPDFTRLDWTRINAAVSRRWGTDGLGRIKELAWRFKG